MDEITMNWIDIGVKILGFVIVLGIAVWTLRSNARLQREQVDRQQSNERQAIRMALLQEFELNCEMLDVKMVSAGHVRSRPHNSVYHALLPKLGTLNASEIQDIFRTHASLSLFAEKVQNRGSKGANMEGYVYFHEFELAGYKQLQVECLPHVRKCIKTIRESVNRE